MHAINLIAQSVRTLAPALPCDPIEATCAVTGQVCPCLPRREVLGDSFTNIDCLRAPESEFVGVDVYIAWFFGYKTTEDKKRLKCPERMASWICDGNEFRELSRIEIREMVLNGIPYKQWAAYVTTSYKKHGSLWARVNIGPRGIWRFEMIDADCRDENKTREYWNRMNAAVNAGIGRGIIETLDMPPYLTMKVGMKTWIEYEKWAKPIYQSGLYQFLAYLLPSAEERINAKSGIGNGGISKSKQLSLF
ncbi:hypothetical protein SPIROBIBN47_410018 [uncultured spirochete]|uniref:Uncharacterized protein n=1 Tax=uncultured spirochete TaxID=156406 RepID=A0A3P3XL65_9SPIR|nr:hypothetical protein SPIROBIBN47_410018 [uncultured spirochete]